MRRPCHARPRAERDAAADDRAPLRPARRRRAFSGGNELRAAAGRRRAVPGDAARRSTRRAREVWLATYIFHFDRRGDARRRGAGARGAARRAGAGRGRRLRHRRRCRALRRCWEAAGVRWRCSARSTAGALLQPGQLRRLHHKLCVVDGELAFFGGINLIDDRLDLRHGCDRRRRASTSRCELRGPLVGADARRPRARCGRGPRFGHDWRDEIVALARSDRADARARAALLQQLRMRRAASGAAAADGCRPVRAAFVRARQPAPAPRDRALLHRCASPARAAHRHRLRRTSIPGAPLPPRAARRGRARRAACACCCRASSTTASPRLAARALYDELLSHGVRDLRVHAGLPACQGGAGRRRLGHASAARNIDPLSLLLNLEANVVIQRPRRLLLPPRWRRARARLWRFSRGLPGHVARARRCRDGRTRLRGVDRGGPTPRLAGFSGRY